MKTLSIKELNNYIKNIYDKDFILRDFYVKGEISNYKESHHNYYFTIKDPDGASIDCIMFAATRSNLPYDFASGQNVIINGRLSFYEKSGRTSIIVKTMEIEGLGKYYIELEKLKKKLEEMGMFDPMYKKDIPIYTTKIGVVTSKNGAAIEDIKKTIFNKNPHIEILLYGARVQGEGASDTLIEGIETLDKTDVDLIIIARGGGSKEDLIAFNDERLAYTIFKAEKPIISAVGHEIDTSICDLVADLRVATPTAAGEASTYDYEELMGQLSEIDDGMRKIIKEQVSQYRDKIEGLSQDLIYLSPISKINRLKEKYDMKKTLLDNTINERYREIKNKYNQYIDKMKTCDALDKMKKGFAYVTDDKNKKIVSAKKIKKDDKLQLRFADGKINTKVI